MIAEQFHCGACSRFLPLRLLSHRELVDSKERREPLCKQCNGFWEIGFASVVEKITAEGKHVDEAAQRSRPASDPLAAALTAPPVFAADTNLAELQHGLVATKTKDSDSGLRAASVVECEALMYRSLAVERYVEGFVKGLEAAGLERERLSPDAASAINSLLSLCHKLLNERLKVRSNQYSRAAIRRLMRHMEETELMVKEYVRAIDEGLRELRREMTSRTARRSRS